MTDTNFNAEPLVFKELPKEQQKALRDEYSKISKAGRNLIIATVIMAAAMIGIAILGVLTDHKVFSGVMIPVWIIPIFAASNEDKFAKWLEAEKNIIYQRKKEKTKNK